MLRPGAAGKRPAGTPQRVALATIGNSGTTFGVRFRTVDLIYEEPEIIDMEAQPWPPLLDSELQESDDLEATKSTDENAPYFEGWEPSQELVDVEIVD